MQADRQQTEKQADRQTGSCMSVNIYALHKFQNRKDPESYADRKTKRYFTPIKQKIQE
jgi:hypothetical protein